MAFTINDLISGVKNFFGGATSPPPQILHQGPPANWVAPQQMPQFAQPQQPQQDMGAMLKQLLDFKREQIQRQNGMSPERTAMYQRMDASNAGVQPSWGKLLPQDFVHLHSDQPAVDTFRAQQPASPEQMNFQRMAQLMRPAPPLTGAGFEGATDADIAGQQAANERMAEIMNKFNLAKAFRGMLPGG